MLWGVGNRARRWELEGLRVVLREAWEGDLGKSMCEGSGAEQTPRIQKVPGELRQGAGQFLVGGQMTVPVHCFHLCSQHSSLGNGNKAETRVWGLRTKLSAVHHD